MLLQIVLLHLRTVKQVRPWRTESLSSLMLQVTLLHLSTVKQLLRSALAKHAVDVVEARVHSLYDSLPQGQWALLRQTLAGFLLGKRVKVRHPATFVIPCAGHDEARAATGAVGPAATDPGRVCLGEVDHYASSGSPCSPHAPHVLRGVVSRRSASCASLCRLPPAGRAK